MRIFRREPALSGLGAPLLSTASKPEEIREIWHHLAVKVPVLALDAFKLKPEILVPHLDTPDIEPLLEAEAEWVRKAAVFEVLPAIHHGERQPSVPEAQVRTVRIRSP